jgi:hypothetical protein
MNDNNELIYIKINTDQAIKSSELDLNCRKNIRDFSSKLEKEYVPRLHKALGENWNISFDWIEIYKQAKQAANEGSRDDVPSKLGEIFLDKGGYVDEVIKNLEELVKDEMNKEAFNEKCSAKNIISRT